MQEAWIQLRCPDCGAEWEENPADLPAPDTDYACDGCYERRTLAEFAKTARDYEILREFTQLE